MVNTTCFSNIRSELIRCLNEAEQEVTVAMAWFTNQELFHTLLQLLSKGVHVELILLDDVINHCSFGVDFNQFIEKGGNFYLYPKSLSFMHNKFCVIDNKIAITGSYNWTNYAETRNLENIIVTDDEKVIEDYKGYFMELKQNLNLCEKFRILEVEDIEEIEFVSRFNDIYIETHSAQNYCETWKEKFKERVETCNITLPLVTADNEVSETNVVQDKRVVQSNNSNMANANQQVNTVVVKPIENHKCPVSKYHIGFKAYLKDKQSEGLKVMVEKGQVLPFVITREAETNLDNITSMECEFYYGATKELSACKKFVGLKLNDIPSMKKGEVKFRTSLTIDTNGYMSIEFVCTNTGKGEKAEHKEGIDFVEYKE